MPAVTIERPYFPIIFLRGYAMSAGEIEETSSDPYMGFNIGATKIRQLWDGKIDRFYFESPVIRLMKDFGYQDVYSDGDMMATGVQIGPRSIVIHRYYDQGSVHLGTGERGTIEEYALGLHRLILTLRERICGDDQSALSAFRVYLVAHSMGGLICRCMLQNSQIGSPESKQLVDKVFTYATPHNGIDLQVLGNVSGLLAINQSDTFNQTRMREYLELDRDEPASTLKGPVGIEKFFCLVGTNHQDYDVAHGLVRKFVGPMSDGLVKIENATVTALDAKKAPRAFVHRSHSGPFGIVNSEEGYQNLTRFLFGDVRVNCLLEVKELTLPPKVEALHKQGKSIRASYHFEVVARVRGGRWDLHRRTVAEQSAIFRTFDEMLKPGNHPGQSEARHPYLFSVFLRTGARVNPRRPSLGFCLDLGVLVPQYEVDHKLWFDDHYDGGYLFRDKLNLEAVPPNRENSEWRLNYGFDSSTPNRATKTAGFEVMPGQLQFRIPIEQKTRPGLSATLVLTAQNWNEQSPAINENAHG